MKKRALVSVSDKSGIEAFCLGLEKLDYEIVSTGGTLRQLQKSGVKAISISEITGFPECLDGRVKTLHPNVHAGILAMRSSAEHMEQLEKLKIVPIDLVIVNLYPFKETISKPNTDFAFAVENIDIGGPTMLRSAAKNYQDVLPVVDPEDYDMILQKLASGGVEIETRKRLMYKVFQHTAVYDTLISTYLRQKLEIEFPQSITFAYEKCQDMRYGENPHQHAVYYKETFPYPGALSEAKQLHGKELSYNNINDTNGALDLLREFQDTAAVAVKHANPCGVGCDADLFTAYKKAYDCDPVSIFGGIVATNAVMDEKTAEEIAKIFIEIVVAKGFTLKALEILSKKQNIRLLELPTINAALLPHTYEMKKVTGGLLVQEANACLYEEKDIRVATKVQPTKKQLEEMRFAMKVVKHTKSNAIVLAKDGMSVGIGAGQTNRIWAADQAIEHAGGRAKGSVLASDAFFPFSDCVEAAHRAGIAAIIQPGGSIRDNESIEACDRYGIPMVFTGIRHFRH